MTGHLTLRERIADAIARTDCDTQASIHPLMEDYLPHADAALEAGIDRRLAYHDRRVEWARRAGREEAQDQLSEEIQARDAERDEEIAIRDAEIGRLRLAWQSARRRASQYRAARDAREEEGNR